MASNEPLIDELEEFLRDEMKKVRTFKGATEDAPTLTDKMKVADRVLKLLAIKAKMEDDDEGAALREDT